MNIRWIERDKKMVLQAEVHIAGVSGWQDVPTHQEPKKMTVEEELAKVLWGKESKCGAKDAIAFFKARMPIVSDGWLWNERLAYEQALKDVRLSLFGEA